MGRYGNLPYIGVCNMKNFLSKLLEKHAKLNEVEPDLPIRRIYTINLFRINEKQKARKLHEETKFGHKDH